MKPRRQSGAVSDGASRSPESFWEIPKQNIHSVFVLLSFFCHAHVRERLMPKTEDNFAAHSDREHKKRRKEKRNTNSFQTTFLQKEAGSRRRLSENGGTLPGFDFFPFRLISVPKLHNKVLGWLFFLFFFFLFFVGCLGTAASQTAVLRTFSGIQACVGREKLPVAFFQKTPKKAPVCPGSASAVNFSLDRT